VVASEDVSLPRHDHELAASSWEIGTREHLEESLALCQTTGIGSRRVGAMNQRCGNDEGQDRASDPWQARETAGVTKRGDRGHRASRSERRTGAGVSVPAKERGKAWVNSRGTNYRERITEVEHWG